MATPVCAAQLPKDAQEILGSDTSDLQSVLQWQWSDVVKALWDYAVEGMAKPMRFGVRVAVYLLFAGVLRLVPNEAGWRRCVEVVAVLGFASLSLAAMAELTTSVGQTAQDCQNYLISFVPVYSGIAAMGGQTAGALVYSGMFSTMSGFLAALIQNVLLPIMQIYFCFAACACVWGNTGVEESAMLFARALTWLLKLCAWIFGFVLGLQNVLADTVDSAALRTGKGILQGAIPVVGDAAAAALSGAASAVQMLKGSLALALLLAIAAAFIPCFLGCVLHGAAFALAGAAASASGQRQCGRLCRLYFEGAQLCAAVLALYFFMVFLSTAFLLIAGNGGA